MITLSAPGGEYRTSSSVIKKKIEKKGSDEKQTEGKRARMRGRERRKSKREKEMQR